jgi:hypothetical protein
MEISSLFGVVTSVTGSSCKIVISGLATGLSGLTANANLYKVDAYYGKALTTSTAIIWSKKYIKFSLSLSTSGSSGSIWYPVGFTPTSTKLTGTGTASTTGASGAEYELTCNNTTITFDLTNEYTSL